MNIKKTSVSVIILLLLLAYCLQPLDRTSPASAQDEQASDNITALAPGQQETDNTTSLAPGQQETDNTTSLAPGQQGSDNITALAPDQQESDNITALAPDQEETDNTIVLAPDQQESDNTKALAPSQQEIDNVTALAPSQQETDNTTVSTPGQPETDNTTASAPSPRENVTPTLTEQLTEIIQEKRDLTPAQKKIDQNIRRAVKDASKRVSKKRAREKADFKGLSSPILNISDSGGIEVTLTVRDQTPEHLEQLESLGMNVKLILPKYGIIEGSLPYDQMEAVASLDFVSNVGLPGYAIYNTGDVTSEGDAVLLADQARTVFGVDGSGVKVGVISDGVTHLSASVASGDLPSSVDVLKAGSGDEGTAMLEIIHDLAPGASLAFYGSSSSADMVAGISVLEAAGCQVIVDDITYFNEPKFEDGPIAQEARDFYNNGGIYVTSAGNSGDRHYSSIYNRSTDNVTINGKEYYVHDYVGGDIGNTFTVPNGGVLLPILHWNDQWGSSANDFDIYLIRQSDNYVLEKGTNVQGGNGNPWEGLYWTNNTGATIVVYLAIVESHLVNQPSSMMLDYIVYGASMGLEYVVPEDSVIGHEAVTEVLSTAAAPADNPDTIESFSSRGPATIYFPSQESRQLPNIAGVDGVQTKTGQLGYFANPFDGTSAAAPHIAAIAALVWSANPSLSQSDVFNAITTMAVDKGDPGWDGTWGFGRTDAYAAVASVMSPTVTSITPGSGDPGTILTGVQISGTNFQDGATVSFSGTGVTASNISVVSSTNITADVTIDAGAAAGARDVIVTQGGISGTGTGLFTVNTSITVTAPSAVDLGLMTAGETTSGFSMTPGTVSTNADSWQVTARDENGSNTGYMVNGGAAPLAAKFQISADSVNFEDADVGITYDSVTSLPFYVWQAVTQDDPGGSYTITITFAGSIP